MKKFLVAMGVAAFAFVGCVDDSSYSSGPDDDSSSSEKAVSSSSEIAETSSSFNPDEYRTCDKKYEGKFLLYQYRETLDAWYGTYRVNTVFYKCKNGKWSGPSATSLENLTEGDVIRAAPDGWEGDEFHVAPDDWECDAENEGQVQSWRFMVFAVPHSPMGYTPTYYARCEQGDWVLCEPESSSSSSMDNASSSSVKSSSSSSVILSASEESSSSVVESSSSVEESSSSEVTPQSSSSSADVQSSSSETESSSSSSEVKLSSSSDGFDWNLPKEAYLNPEIEYDTIIDSRDGKVYRTVKIGEQTWMAENLNYYDDSDLSVKEKSWCYGKNDNGDSTTCDVAGRLYTWAAAIDSARLYADKSLVCGYGIACALPDTVYGICPSGWHLPNKAEWEALFSAVGGKSTAGTVLKSQMGWTKNGNGTDAFGFSALPVGFRADNSRFYGDDEDAYFWSSTMKMDVRNTPYSMSVYYDEKSAYMNFDMKFSFSVRCLKNN